MSEDNQNTINIPIYSLISKEIEDTGQKAPLFTPAETALLLLAAITTDGYGELPIGFLLNESVLKVARGEAGFPVDGLYRIRVSTDVSWLANIYFDGIDDVNTQAHGILELKLLAAAYEIFGDSRLAPLLKGDFATPAERLADIESTGVWISGWGVHHQESEEVAANLKVTRDENDEFSYELSYVNVNATCATQTIKWNEGATDSEDPPDIVFKNKVKNLTISDLHADKLSVQFCHDLSDSGFYNTDLAEIAFQHDFNPIVLSDIKLDDTNFGKLDIGAGTTLINCDFNTVKVDRLAQNSLIYGNEHEVGNAVITKFQECTLRSFRAPCSALNDKGHMPFFSYNWEFTGGEINQVVLPRSPQTQKYVFNQSTVADLAFAPPDEPAGSTNEPAGRLDVHLNGGSLLGGVLWGVHAPPLEYRNSDTAPSEYATISFTADREGFAVPTPRGHWDEINLLGTSFSEILAPANSTCNSLVISELKVGEASSNKAASGALDVVWKQYFSGDTTKVDIIDDLPRIDPCSRATKDKYLLALLGMVITPDNVDAIQRVSQVTAPVAVNTKTTDKTKKAVP